MIEQNAQKDTAHCLSLLVANRPGVLVRIALVFSRRGYNLDSLVVSPTLNPDFSRMNIVAHGNPEILVQIIKQLEKLYDALHVLINGQKKKGLDVFELLKISLSTDNPEVHVFCFNLLRVINNEKAVVLMKDYLLYYELILNMQ